MTITNLTAAWPWSEVVGAAAIVVVLILWWRERTERRRLSAHLRRERSGAAGAAEAPPAGSTGQPAVLLDRRQLEEAIDRHRAAAPATGAAPCLLWLIVDDLRKLQHEQLPTMVEAALLTLCRRVLLAVPPGARVARLGPAEHAVFVPAGTEATALGLAEALRAKMAEPIGIGGRDVRLSISIGVVAGRQEATVLCARAAVAMRSVRHAGGDGVAVFAPHMALDEQERADLVNDLRAALQRRQMEVFYQPSVDTRTMEVPSAEALLRWRHPQRGLVPPSEFLRLAEQSGLIESLGNWVLDNALDQAAEWQKRKLGLRVAVNLSAFQMRQDTLAARIEHGLRAHQLSPGAMCYEIDAERLADDAPGAQRLLARLAKIGVHVSIDNFGHGEPNLPLLRRVPAEEVKLHRSLVHDLGEHSGADARCKAIIDMAHSRGLRVVATGVETEEQRDRLMALGCDALQGHLFAKAMSPKALSLWVSDSPQARVELFRATLFKETEPFERSLPFAETMPMDALTR